MNYLEGTSPPKATMQNWKENIGKTSHIKHLFMEQM
jgi:hypothetical protein